MARAERNKTILEARISDAEKSRRMAEIRAQEAERPEPRLKVPEPWRKLQGPSQKRWRRN